MLATIVIDRSNGVILNTSGSLSSIRGPPTAGSPSLSKNSSPDLSDESGMHDMARMVWNYMVATRELVQGLDSQVWSLLVTVNMVWTNTEQDEVKLLRLRTKKYELVIVPDPKYVLVVVHETPSA